MSLETITLKTMAAAPKLSFGASCHGIKNFNSFKTPLKTLFLKYSFILGQEFSVFSNLVIDLFTDKEAMLNILDLRSIMGCPGGHSLSIYALSSGKKRA